MPTGTSAFPGSETLLPNCFAVTHHFDLIHLHSPGGLHEIEAHIREGFRGRERNLNPLPVLVGGVFARTAGASFGPSQEPLSR